MDIGASLELRASEEDVNGGVLEVRTVGSAMIGKLDLTPVIR